MKNLKSQFIIYLTTFLFWICFGVSIWLIISVNIIPQMSDPMRVYVNILLGILFIIHLIVFLISGSVWFYKKLRKRDNKRVKIIFFINIIGLFCLVILWGEVSYLLHICCSLKEV